MARADGFTEDDFTDLMHLSVKGAEKLSGALAKELFDRGFSDPSSQADRRTIAY